MQHLVCIIIVFTM